MDNPIDSFIKEKNERVKSYEEKQELKKAAAVFNLESNKHQYSYNFSWMGRPIIQYPQDMIAMQELIWDIRPDLVIETGVAHGGSLIYYASLLELIGHGSVIGIDIDIRAHNKKEIESHPMYKRITLLEGSSISEQMITEVELHAKNKKKIMVCLDSNHTHEHVLHELNLYSRFVTIGSYLVVFDTIVEYLPDNYLPGRPWKKGNNPKTAIDEFLAGNPGFVPQKEIDLKLMISVAPGGYLKRIG